MPGFEAFLIGRFMLFTLVLTRTGALVMTAPIFGSVAIPRRVRGLLAVTMSLLVTPVYLGTSVPSVEYLGEYGRMLINEALVGLLLGAGMNILFAGIQVAGQVVSQMSGLSLADVFNPGFDEEVSVFSQLFYFLTLAVFVAVGGHRMVTESLLQTFAWAPPGNAALGDDFLEVVCNIATQSFALGIRAAAPVLIALLLSTLVLGLISRTVPQINIIAVGFGLNSMLLIGVLLLSLGAVAWAFQAPVVDLLHELQDTVVVSR